MKLSNLEQFIQKAVLKHGFKYDYSKFIYVNNATKGLIICPIHGEFWQTPNRHLCTNGCKKCGIMSRLSKIKFTTEEFIEKARAIHGDKYDYSQVVYINSDIKVKIICPIHGEFWQKPSTHLNGSGCKKCYHLESILTTEEFIEKARAIHGDYYDYSKVIYINSHTKIIIICPIHGEFRIVPSYHLQKYGCKKCAKESRITNISNLIIRAIIVHNNKYSYDKINIIDRYLKVTITCPVHGDFEQNFYNHLQGQGCPKCNLERLKNNPINKLTLEEFIKRARLIHGDRYDYSKSIYINSHTKIIIICPIHGEFLQTPNSHLNNSGCPICRSSKGELFIKEILDKNNISFQQEYKLPFYKFRYDFYLPDYNALIEFHGIQHYEPIKYMGGVEKLRIIQHRDAIKKSLAKEYRLRLIEINYRQLNKLTKNQFEQLLLRKIGNVQRNCKNGSSVCGISSSN